MINRRNHRAALRDAGMRPITIWLPDTRRAGFTEECRRQSLSLCKDAQETKMLSQLSVVADREGWK